MTTVTGLVEELTTLPPDKFKQAVEYIHKLKEHHRAKRRTVLKATAGAFSHKQAEAFAAAIEQGCERVASVV